MLAGWAQRPSRSSATRRCGTSASANHIATRHAVGSSPRRISACAAAKRVGMSSLVSRVRSAGRSSGSPSAPATSAANSATVGSRKDSAISPGTAQPRWRAAPSATARCRVSATRWLLAISSTTSGSASHRTTIPARYQITAGQSGSAAKACAKRAALCSGTSNAVAISVMTSPISGFATAAANTTSQPTASASRTPSRWAAKRASSCSMSRRLCRGERHACERNIPSAAHSAACCSTTATMAGLTGCASIPCRRTA